MRTKRILSRLTALLAMSGFIQACSQGPLADAPAIEKTARVASPMTASNAGAELSTTTSDGAYAAVTSASSRTPGTFTSWVTATTTGASVLRIDLDPSTTSASFTQYADDGSVVAQSTAPAPGAPTTMEATHALAENLAAAVAMAPKGNTNGCDGLHFLDCRENGPGKCCDDHDACVDEFCSPQCQNLLYAVFHPKECLAPANPDCGNCHGQVMLCFGKKPPAGPSSCCARGDCGKPYVAPLNPVAL